MEKPADPNGPLFQAKAVGASICFFIGVFAVFFSIYRHNYIASSCALVMEIVCVTLLTLYNSYRKGNLQQKFKPAALMFFMVIGVVVGVTMLAAMVYNAYHAVTLKQGFQVHGNGYAPGAILAGLASFWGVILCLDSRNFRFYVENNPV